MPAVGPVISNLRAFRDRAVEFRSCNISTLLAEMGMQSQDAQWMLKLASPRTCVRSIFPRWLHEPHASALANEGKPIFRIQLRLPAIIPRRHRHNAQGCDSRTGAAFAEVGPELVLAE